jgi:Fe-S cluster assembly protein SufD
MSSTGTTNKETDVVSALASAIGTIPAIQQVREDCYNYLQQSGMPGLRHEEYRNTPLTKALEKFDLSRARSHGTVGAVTTDYVVPELDAWSLVFVNGLLDEAQSSAALLPGISVRPLQGALESGEGLVYFAKIANPKKDAFVAWNTVGWDNGAYIEVKDNTIVDKPIIIYHVTDASEGQVVTISRNLIVVGRNCELTFIQKFSSQGTHPRFVSSVTEAVVNENSGLTIYSFQDDAGEHHQFNHTQVLQKDATRVNTFVFTLNGKTIRNNLELSLDGERCESHMFGLYLLKGDTLADNHTVADHLKPNSFSNELYKGVLDDRARGVFNGKIYVRPNAQKTNAFQSNRNILLTDTAKVNTKPQLEIWADDVKCSHGCTTGQLDEEALFYLQTRGIPKSVARAMLLYAFAGELIEAIKVPALKLYLEKIVSSRLQ